MGQIKIQATILQRLYTSYFPEMDGYGLRAIQEEGNWNEHEFWQIVDEFCEAGLIQEYTTGCVYIITDRGIVHTEENDIGPMELVAANRRIRTVALAKYAAHYEEHGQRSELHFRELANTEDNLDPDILATNLLFLSRLGYLRSGSLGSFTITSRGRDAAQAWRRRTTLLQNFESLDNLAPAQRGRVFQRLFTELVQEAGWIAEEGVRASGEEIDVVMRQGDRYCFVECRAKSEPVEAKEVRDFHGKVRDRSTIEGVFVSLSGFTSGAVEYIERTIDNALTSLFGPQDVTSLFTERTSFDDLLQHKRHVLISRRKAEWS
jgi:hypothetical protein